MSSQAEEVLFALKEVTFAYGKDDAAVLRKLTLEIPAGKTTVIMGSSGAGKSTLLSLLGLLWEQDRSHAWQLREGSIAYRREDLQTPQPHTVNYHDLSDADRAYLRSNDFGFVLQSCYLLPFFTCLQNISMPLAMRGLSQSECRQHVVDALHRVAAILEESNLSYPGGDGSATPQAIPEETIPSTPTANDMLGVLDEYKIAGGQRQRAAVLRALIHKPKIIFADEPFSNLDPDNARQYLRILKDWQSGRDASADGGTVKAAARRTLVIVCHDPRVAIEIGE